MPQARANGIVIEYESFGRDSDPALLLVSGWSVQLLSWDEALCRRLAGLGLRVIRFDNRDCGLSTHFDGVEYDLLAAAAAQLRGAEVPAPPYRLSDLADDAIGLLDALGIARAHIVGASMGGMIAQRVAIAYPDRVLSLVSIMSNTGEPGIGDSTPEALAALFTPPPTTRDAYVDHIARVARVIGSKTHFDEQAVRARALAGFDRAYYPEGAVRQSAAVMAETSRAEALAQLRAPTLVVHGRQDPLIGCAAGERTAQLIPGASMLILEGAGHDLPEALWPDIVDAIAAHVEQATTKPRFIASDDHDLSGTFDSVDGLAIFYQGWAPPGAPRGTIIIAHGLAEHSGRYGNVVERLVPLGYVVYALDHRGHGRSDGERCHVDRFDQFVEDLERFRQTIRSVQPTGPMILIGHSMGGAIALGYSIRYQRHLDGLVLSGPASTRGRSFSKFESARIEVLARLTPHRRLPPLPSSAISRDTEVVAAYDSDPLVTRTGPTVRLRNELRRAAGSFPAGMPGVTLPVLLQHGEADELVSVEASTFLADRLGSESITLHTYPALAHEVYNEPERGRVLDDLAAWLTSRW